MIEYQLAALELEKFSTTESISSAHGLLCGYACVNPDITFENWIYEILDEYSKDDDFSVLSAIFNQTLEQLSDSELNFKLLIEDDGDLSIQAGDIKDWCSGFLIGLGLAKIQISGEELEEIIESISQISNLDINIENSPENSNDIMEIVEFVRMGALLIQETINPSKQDFVNPISLH